jgi:hypothetical protein
VAARKVFQSNRFASAWPAVRRYSERLMPRLRASAEKRRFSAAVRRSVATGMYYNCITRRAVSSGTEWRVTLWNWRLGFLRLVTGIVHEPLEPSVAILILGCLRDVL